MTNKQSSLIGKSLSYSAPVITTAWLITPMGIIQGIYAKYYGVSLVTIAAIVFFTRLFDAISDPIIGYFADCHYHRSGTRKPIIILGGLLFIISSLFLYIPPAKVGGIYLMIWSASIYLAWTLFEIPHLAWANTLTESSSDRSLIFSFRTIAMYIGMVLFFSIPLMPFFETNAITPETLRISVILAGSLMILLLSYSMLMTPEIKYASSAKKRLTNLKTSRSSGESSRKTIEVYAAIRFVIANKPLLLFILTYLFLITASGMWFSLIFIYVDMYLGLSDEFAQMFVLAFVGGIIATPFWYKIAFRFDKKATLILAILLISVSFIYTNSLVPIQTTLNELILLKLVQTVGFAGMVIVAPSMLADIVDYGCWKSGVDRASLCYSLYTFINKAGNALGAAIGLGIAGWYGFEVAASYQKPDSIWGLSLAMTWIPLVLAIIALFFVAISPINSRRHAIIRRRMNVLRSDDK